jgi:hypothetical protein
MGLTRPFAIDEAYANAADFRKQHAAIYPRQGVFPDPTTAASAGVAYGNGGWSVWARPFTAVTRRSTSPFLQSYGSALFTNDSAGAAWTIPAAPTSGSRIDLLWARATDPTQGEATTTPSGETAPRAVPVFGVTSGAAATTPTSPALPAGAVLIARVSTPSTATSIANSIITQAYDFAHVLGAPMLVRDETHRNTAIPSPLLGEAVARMDKKWVERWNGTGWAVEGIQAERDTYFEYASQGSTSPSVPGGTVARAVSIPASTQPQRVRWSIDGLISPDTEGRIGIGVTATGGVVVQNPQVRAYAAVGMSYYGYSRKGYVSVPANSTATITFTTEGDVAGRFQVTIETHTLAAGQF